MFGYAEYWAYSIRQALAVKVYRHQALGIFLISINAMVVFVFFPLFAVTSLLVFFVIWQLSILTFNLAVFYWIDSSVLSARRSDPLLRNTLHWQSVRKAIWGIFVGLSVANYVAGIISQSLPSAGFLALVLIPAPVILLFVVGLVSLPISARRSMDMILRRHLKSFAVFLSALYLTVLVPDFLPGGPSVILSPDGLAITFIAYLVVGYFLYGPQDLLYLLTSYHWKPRQSK
jgi:hypothetical protein